MSYWTSVEVDDPEWRQLIAARSNPRAWEGEPGGCVHITARLDPMCWVEFGAKVGAGCQIGYETWICEGAVVHDGVIIGSHVFVGPYSEIGVDSVIGDGARVGADVILAGDVEVGASAVLGRAVAIARYGYVPDGVRITQDLCGPLNGV